MKKRIYAYWKGIVEVAQLPLEMTLHDCRLTHINIIEKLMPNLSVTTLKEPVGHSTSGGTEAKYVHPISTARRILRDEPDRVLGTKPRETDQTWSASLR